MKIELVARKGYPPTALLAHGIASGNLDQAFKAESLAERILGPRVRFSGILSSRWHLHVLGTPEFCRWYEALERDCAPAAEDRIFLEVLNA
jgi:hypothetical protein